MNSRSQQYYAIESSQEDGGRTDGQLLDAFIKHRDANAFQAIMSIHGSMVFGVCRRILGNYHDAEEAFQATFLILASKANSIMPRNHVGNWLYGVAVRTSQNSRRLKQRRRGWEIQGMDSLEPACPRASEWSEIAPILDQELNALPDKYRIPLILCELEGRSHKDVAHELGCPEGTLSSRLMRGRNLLATRLIRHGVVTSAGALSALISQNCASAAVSPSTIQTIVQAIQLPVINEATVQGLIAPQVMELNRSVVQSMFLGQLKSSLIGLGIVLGLGWGVVGLQSSKIEKPVHVAGVRQLPAEIQQALEENARQLSPVTVRYTQQLHSKLPEQETSGRLLPLPHCFTPRCTRQFAFIMSQAELLDQNQSASLPRLFEKVPHCAIWSEPYGYESVRTKTRTSPKSQFFETVTEWSFDGSIHYRGADRIDPRILSQLQKTPMQKGLISETPQFALSTPYMNPYFSRRSGMLFRQHDAKPQGLAAESEILNRLRDGGKLISVEPAELGGKSLQKIEMIVANHVQQIAREVNVDDLRRRSTSIAGQQSQAAAQCSAEEQDKLVENIMQQRALPDTRRLVYYLDPELHLAVVRREEWLGSNQLLVRTDNSVFVQLANRSVWLPKRCVSELHEFESTFELTYQGDGPASLSLYPPTYVAFEETFLSEVIEVQDLEAESVSQEKFVLNYTKPGTYVFDEPVKDKEGKPLDIVTYQVGKTPESTQQNKAQVAEAMRIQSNSPSAKVAKAFGWLSAPGMHRFFVANAVLLLVVGAFFAYRRFLKS